MKKIVPSFTNSVDSGLTFVELLIVVSIITLLTAAAIPGFNTYIITQNLKQSVEQVKNDLRTAQNNALGGVMSVDSDVAYWGIDFSADPYKFKTYDSSGGEANPKNGESLVGDVEVKNSPTILFEMYTGDAFSAAGTRCNSTGSTCSVIVGATDASGTECSSVSANSAGALLKADGVTCP